MHRIAPQDPAQATGKLLDLFAGVQAALGAKLREQIALAVAESNACGYCLSAHAFLGAKAGLSSEEIGDARRASATDERDAAILKLARTIVIERGALGDPDLAEARMSGVTDEEIVETVANVALNVLTNYLNLVARTEIDFPKVRPGVDAETSTGFPA